MSEGQRKDPLGPNTNTSVNVQLIHTFRHNLHMIYFYTDPNIIELWSTMICLIGIRLFFSYCSKLMYKVKEGRLSPLPCWDGKTLNEGTCVGPVVRLRYIWSFWCTMKFQKQGTIQYFHKISASHLLCKILTRTWDYYGANGSHRFTLQTQPWSLPGKTIWGKAVKWEEVSSVKSKRFKNNWMAPSCLFLGTAIITS